MTTMGQLERSKLRTYVPESVDDDQVFEWLEENAKDHWMFGVDDDGIDVVRFMRKSDLKAFKMFLKEIDK